MKTLLLTLLSFTFLTTIIAENEQVNITSPVSNILMYSAQLTQEVPFGFKQFIFESKITLDTKTRTAQVIVISYKQTNTDDYYQVDFNEDIRPQIIKNLSLWFSENTNITSFTCIMPDDNNKAITVECRNIYGCIENNDLWHSISMVKPDILMS